MLEVVGLERPSSYCRRYGRELSFEFTSPTPRPLGAAVFCALSFATGADWSPLSVQAVHADVTAFAIGEEIQDDT